MLFLTTYIFDPPPEEIVFALAIFFVPAAILWGISRGKVLGPNTYLLIKSLMYGFGGTGLLMAFSIFVAFGTLVGHYHSYSISLLDPMFWLVRLLGLPVACITCILVIGLASLIVMKWGRKQ